MSHFTGSGRFSNRRFLLSSIVFFFCAVFVPQVLAREPGQIIREARCKVLIRSGFEAQQGDVLPVVRKKTTSGGQENVVGQVRILKINSDRVIGRVVEPRSDCRKLLGGYVTGTSSAAIQSEGQDRLQKSAVKGPPPPLRALLSAGPGIVSATLKGISRSTVVETYPLVLSSAQVSAEVFPLALFGRLAEPRQAENLSYIFGFEGVFRFVAALNDVRVTIPSATSGQEVDLDLRANRTFARTGALIRYPLWKGRLFLDARGGYLFNSFISGISKFVKTPAAEPQPIEISPLRDLSLGGFYTLGGFQFQPVDKFRARVNAGTMFGVNYRLDNRLPDAGVNANAVSTPVNQPSLFLLEASFNYLFKNLSVGLDVSVESLSGRALFPDGRNEGVTAEVYSGYGLNLAFLL